MTTSIVKPENLAPANGEANDNLQNNSEENTQSENAEPSNGSGRRHYRRDNKQIARLKNTKSQKQKKMKRLLNERDGKKADLDRGYINVRLGDDSERVKQVGLEPSDREMIRSVIAEKDYEIYELDLDISEIDLKIRALASAKKSTFKNRLTQKKANKKEDDLVNRVNRELSEASKNGGKELISDIQKQIQAGNTHDAYNSLKSFLSQEVKTVSKKLAKSVELEKSVLDRVLDKLSVVQS